MQEQIPMEEVGCIRFWQQEANDRVPDSESREKGKGFDLKDGKYTGSANGYGGKITVTVTIKNKKIVKISH